MSERCANPGCSNAIENKLTAYGNTELPGVLFCSIRCAQESKDVADAPTIIDRPNTSAEQ